MSADITPHNAPRTPLEVCIALIGRPEEISRIVGDAPNSAYNWAHPSSTRDAGDIPSARKMRRLLAHSAANHLGLTADHLIWGATEADVAAILAARGRQQVAAE